MVVSRRVLLAAIFPGLAQVQSSSASVAAPIVALNAALIAVMRPGDLIPLLYRDKMLARAVDQVLDLQSIIRISVGAYWSCLSQAKQQKLIESFDIFSGEVSSVSLTTRVLGAQQVVTSTLSEPSDNSIRGDDVMGRADRRWKAQDIRLDRTISRVTVQRSDLTSLLSQGDASQLIASLEQKISTFSSCAIST
jgi:phospholipid transport system substrate-binding protein